MSKENLNNIVDLANNRVICNGITNKNIRCKKYAIGNFMQCYQHLNKIKKYDNNTNDIIKKIDVLINNMNVNNKDMNVNNKDMNINNSMNVDIKETEINKEENKENYISEGTYSKVYFDKDDKNIVEKHLTLFNAGTVNELMFYREYIDSAINNFPKLYNTIIDPSKDLLILKLSYEGETLHRVANKLKYGNRLKVLPSLIDQFIDILNWFENKRLIHMDIKPDNICWGKSPIEDLNPIIKIIDFGFVIPDVAYKRSHIGTHCFADPSYFYKRLHNIKYDVFSFGLTLMFWISKKIIQKDIRNINKDSDIYAELGSLEDIKKNMDVKDQKYLNAIEWMLKLDETMRFSPKDLLVLKRTNYNLDTRKDIVDSRVINAIFEKCDILPEYHLDTFKTYFKL